MSAYLQHSLPSILFYCLCYPSPTLPPPLRQVFANIAIIITEEESPSEKAWFTWRDVFHLVDIICCCAILFPIVWSIKHLREASQTDGKAVRNLEKLTLFRQVRVWRPGGAWCRWGRAVLFLPQLSVHHWLRQGIGAEQLTVFSHQSEKHMLSDRCVIGLQGTWGLWWLNFSQQ